MLIQPVSTSSRHHRVGLLLSMHGTGWLPGWFAGNAKVASIEDRMPRGVPALCPIVYEPVHLVAVILRGLGLRN